MTDNTEQVALSTEVQSLTALGIKPSHAVNQHVEAKVEACGGYGSYGPVLRSKLQLIGCIAAYQHGQQQKEGFRVPELPVIGQKWDDIQIWCYCNLARNRPCDHYRIRIRIFFRSQN